MRAGSGSGRVGSSAPTPQSRTILPCGRARVLPAGLWGEVVGLPSEVLDRVCGPWESLSAGVSTLHGDWEPGVGPGENCG